MTILAVAIGIWLFLLWTGLVLIVTDDKCPAWAALWIERMAIIGRLPYVLFFLVQSWRRGETTLAHGLANVWRSFRDGTP